MADMFVLRDLHTEGQKFLITKSITLLFCLHWLMLIRFLTVDVGQYWRFSDGNVFANSNIAMRLARQNIGLPPDENLRGFPLPYIVTVDEVFPLKKYLMRPYPRRARRRSEAERIFNYRLSKAEIQ